MAINNASLTTTKTPFYAVCEVEYDYAADNVRTRLYADKRDMDAYLNNENRDDDDNAIDDVYDLASCTEYLKANNGCIVGIYEGRLY